MWETQKLASTSVGTYSKGAQAWYFHVAEGTGAMFSLPQISPNAYTNLSFYTWYIIANTVLGYGMNASCIKAINSTYSVMTVRKKRMNEYLEAEKKAGACEAAERVVGTAEEHSIKKFRQAMAKRAHPSSFAGGSSRKQA